MAKSIPNKKNIIKNRMTCINNENYIDTVFTNTLKAIKKRSTYIPINKCFAPFR